MVTNILLARKRKCLSTTEDMSKRHSALWDRDPSQILYALSIQICNHDNKLYWNRIKNFIAINKNRKEEVMLFLRKQFKLNLKNNFLLPLLYEKFHICIRSGVNVCKGLGIQYTYDLKVPFHSVFIIHRRKSMFFLE